MKCKLKSLTLPVTLCSLSWSLGFIKIIGASDGHVIHLGLKTRLQAHLAESTRNGSKQGPGTGREDRSCWPETNIALADGKELD